MLLSTGPGKIEINETLTAVVPYSANCTVSLVVGVVGGLRLLLLELLVVFENTAYPPEPESSNRCGPTHR